MNYQFGAKITIFGDSITRNSMDPETGCFSSYLAHEVINYYTIDVKGFSGYTTRSALPLVPKLFTKEYLRNVHYIIIFFGHNDSWQEGPFPGVPLNQYKDNLLIMVKLLIEDGMTPNRIMLVTPGWFHESDWLKWQKRNLTTILAKSFENCRLYAEATQEVASETGVALTDWFKVTSNYKPLKELFCDGLHLSRKGAKLFFDTIWPELKSTIENIHGKTVDQITIADPPKELLDWMVLDSSGKMTCGPSKTGDK